jgi:2-polyprenyl-3-methyl-5-hydroxy-6-metoxy-1,4-benzoquinol methylase
VVESFVARAYDAIAAEYDAQLEKNPVAVYMRAELHAHLARTFHAGARVLDFTTGTGSDALFLAERGIQVTAIDISPRMTSELEEKAAQRGLPLEVRVLPAERMGELCGQYDGALSTFAGLNTIEDMPRLGRDLAARVKQRGRVIIHALNEFCLWQALAHRGERDGNLRVGGEIIPHRLYNPFQLWRAAFAPHFEVRQIYALSVIAAPAVVKRMPRYAPLIFRLDCAVGKLLPALGDFFVMDLERSDERGRAGH